MRRCRGATSSSADTAGLHNPAVGDQFPRQFIIVQPHEEILVVHLHAALRRIEKLGPDILVLPLHLIGVRMPRAVGRDDAVAVERIVGRVVVVEIAAVEERHAAVLFVAGESLIDESPR